MLFSRMFRVHAYSVRCFGYAGPVTASVDVVAIGYRATEMACGLLLVDQPRERGLPGVITATPGP